MKRRLLVAVWAASLATRAAAGAPPLAVHAEAGPDGVALGERVHYRGWVVVPHAQSVSWITPRADGPLAWGTVAPSRVPGAAGTDTARVDADLQVFALGRVDVPGIHFALPRAGGVERALPIVHLGVRAILTAADSAARFKPVRGPLAAPWWERVSWRWVALALAVLAIVAAWLRSRRRRPMIVRARPAARAVADPAAEALAELAALRRRELPAHGRYAEHAFQLTLILRRFLERSSGGMKPGLTSRELVGWLEGHPTRIDVVRLDALLRVWDILKFARAPGSMDQSRDSEAALEAWLRASIRAPEREVA